MIPLKCFPLFFFLKLLFSLPVCAQPAVAKHGLFLFQSTVGSDSLTTDRIWFNDSSVIYEQNSNYVVRLNDSIIFKEYAVMKYTFFDLRTLKCQDYLSFADTAGIEHNYFVKINEPPGWDFYNGNSNRSADSMSLLSDTVIKEKQFKRVLYKEEHSHGEYLYNEIQYWLCNDAIIPLFHTDKRLEKCFSGCRVEKIEMKQLAAPHQRHDSVIFKLERTYLTTNEKLIFQRWQKNATETNKEVITIDEVRKKPLEPIKFKMSTAYKKLHSGQ